MFVNSQVGAVIDASVHPRAVVAGLPTIGAPRRPPAAPGTGAAEVEPPADDDLAYVVHTSGTTGRSKAVGVRFGGLRVVGAEQRRVLGAGPGARVFQAAPLSFDAFVFEVLMMVDGGATLVLPGPDALRPGPAMTRQLARDGVTHLVTTPTALARLDPAALPDLRVVCSVGEACTRAVSDAWGAGRRLFNLYGPAEATIWATWARLRPGDDPRRIGEPLAGVTAHVLDERRQPVTPGEPGVLHLAGPTLARGYLGDPELTAERFVPGPAGRMYVTGDVVRETGAGLVFVGRDDRQIKVRGVRVEPGEVEQVLLGLPGVTAAVAMVTPGDGAFVAVFTRHDDGPSERDAGARLRAVLPRWKCPQYLVAVGELPVAATGKLDERAVAALIAERRLGPGRDDGSPLLEIVRDLLDDPTVGPDDNFFDVGGHSLLVLDLVARVAEVTGCEPGTEALFTGENLGEWVRSVEESIAQPAGSKRPVPVPAPAGFDRPSVNQLELLAAESLLGGAAAYVSAWCEDVTGPFDPERFAGALRLVAGRHDTLASRFTVDGGRIVRSAGPAAPSCEVVAAGHTFDEAVALATAAGRTGFRLDAEPPLRLHVVRTGPERHLVTLLIHHSVLDQAGIAALLDEVWSAYDGYEAREAGLGYADFGFWQHEFLAGPAAEESRRWWRDRLAGTRALRLAADRRPAARGTRLRFTLEPATAEALRATASAARVTEFAVLSAAFAVAVRDCFGEDRCVVGTPVSARGAAAFERTLGFFVNTLPLVLAAPRVGPAGDWLAAWNRECLESLVRRDLPLAEITRAWQPAGQRLEVLFSVGRLPAAGVTAEGVRRDPVPLDLGLVKFPLVFTVNRAGDRWRGEIVHELTAVSDEEASALLERFRAALEFLCGPLERDLAALEAAEASTVPEFDF